MGKSRDFENYDYDGFFSKLEDALKAFEAAYDPVAQTLKVMVNNSSNDYVIVRIVMHDRVQLDCEIGDVGEDAKTYCRKHTGHEGHLIFSERNNKVSAHIQVPLHLGQGWDDAVISSATTAVEEMADYLGKTKAA